MNPSIISTMKKNDFVKKTYRWGREKISRFHNMIDGVKYTLAEGRRLRQFKDIYKGERCFIIGNGPSLKMHDLTKLAEEKKFAVNMFLSHPDLEKIHLDFFCVCDPIHWNVNGGFPQSWYMAFKKLPYCLLFFKKDCIPVYKSTAELQDRLVYFINLDSSRHVFEGDFSVNVPSHTCWGRTVIIDLCLPLAFYFGFKEVFLLGCDCDYKLSNGDNYEKSFFYDRKLDERNIPKETGDALHIRQVMSSYGIVKKIFEAHGRKIYNAGYGGKLEVFERVNYDDLF